MNPANATNATASAGTSTSDPSAHAPSPRTVPSKLSEAEYLQQQASAAKSALSGAVSGLGRDLVQGLDPRALVQSHPWVTLASATAAGFLAAVAVVPSKEQQALRKLSAIERALNESRQAAHPSTNGDSHKKDKGGFLGTLLHEMIGALKPVIAALVTTHLNPNPDAAAQAAEAATGSGSDYPGRSD